MLSSLLLALLFRPQVFGLHYDLDLFDIVAVSTLRVAATCTRCGLEYPRATVAARMCSYTACSPIPTSAREQRHPSVVH